MPQGKVKWFSAKKGYGFIKEDDKDRDIFLHITALEKSKLSKLSTSISLPLNFNFDPALLDDATRYKLLKEKFFFSKTSIIFLPTFPVAPTIAIFMMN